MNKIKNVSFFLKLIFLVCIAIYPIALAIAWAKAPSPLLEINNTTLINLFPQEYPILHELSITTRIVGFVASLATNGLFTLLIFYFLIKLFSLYQQGKIFTVKNVTYLKYIGYTLFIEQCIAPFHEGLLGVILTWGNPAGHRFANMTIATTDIEVILISVIVLLISWIMGEACKIQEELEHTI